MTASLGLAIIAVLVSLVALMRVEASFRAVEEAELLPKTVRELVDEMDTALDKLNAAYARDRMARKRAQDKEPELSEVVPSADRETLKRNLVLRARQQGLMR